jgi:hypothetical protein
MTDAVKLLATSRDELSVSIQRLRPGQTGWITITEAAYLFAGAFDAAALDQFDQGCLVSLGAFAADNNASARNNTAVGRVSFTRKNIPPAPPQSEIE